MSTEHPKKPEYSTDEEINLLDYVAVIVKHRRMIISMCSMVVIISVIVSLLLPKIYSATATIMPPKKEDSMSSLAAKMGDLAILAGGALEGDNSVEIYVDILKSRTVTDTIITRFNLMQVYDVKLMKEARKQLENNLSIETSKSNAISIMVEDKDPQRVADIANAYVEELDKLNRKLNISDAALQRIFLEKRLTETKERLSKAEVQLKGFQEENKIVALEAQAEAAIEGAALIKAEIIATETELKMLEGFVSGNENQVIRLKQKLAELKEQLAKIEVAEGLGNNPGKAGNSNPGGNKAESNFYLTFTQMPTLGLQMARLMREVKVQEVVFKLLTQQYEMARIAEAKDTSTIQVLDKAVVPEEKSKPKRILIVALSGIVTLFGSVFMAFIFEYFERLDAKDKRRWQAIKLAARGKYTLG